jgi:hypothetical protein
MSGHDEEDLDVCTHRRIQQLCTDCRVEALESALWRIIRSCNYKGDWHKRLDAAIANAKELLARGHA